MRKNRSQKNNPQKQDSEFEQKLLDVARVARVTSGGRRFSFRTVVVIGDKAGRVGVGTAKGKDVQASIEKAARNGKKNMFNVSITKEGSLPHEVYGKSSSAFVFLKPAPAGRGIIAGGAVRVVCDLAGYKDIIGKMISRTNNKLNNARATVEALKTIKQKEGQSLRGGTVPPFDKKRKTSNRVKKNANTSTKDKE